jgi:hypothetical protein
LPSVALLDADVLYPAKLRDLLLSAGEAGLYRTLWTQRILDEMVNTVLDDRPDLTARQLRRTVDFMVTAFPDAMVTGYEPLEAVMTNSEEDRHVLAACVRGRADVLVTRNVRDFPPECCLQYDIDVQTPDQFLLYAYDLRPDGFMAAVAAMLSRNQAPPTTIAEFVESLAVFTPQLVERVASEHA